MKHDVKCELRENVTHTTTTATVTVVARSLHGTSHLPQCVPVLSVKSTSHLRRAHAVYEEDLSMQSVSCAQDVHVEMTAEVVSVVDTRHVVVRHGCFAQKERERTLLNDKQR